MYSSQVPQFNRRRARALTVTVIALILAILGGEIYRPYIYHSAINDFGIAGIVGYLFASIAAIFLIVGLTPGSYRAGIAIIAGVTLGLIGYEFIQLGRAGTIFNGQNVLAALIGGGISVMIFRAAVERRRVR